MRSNESDRQGDRDWPAGQHVQRIDQPLRHRAGYHVTLVKDATAAFSKDRMHAAHELNRPSFAQAILTTRDLVSALREGSPRSE
jgi:nicotinamidase-related amidase